MERVTSCPGMIKTQSRVLTAETAENAENGGNGGQGMAKSENRMTNGGGQTPWQAGGIPRGRDRLQDGVAPELSIVSPELCRN